MFVALILIFLIPFGTAVETILNKTQRPSMTVITNAFNRAYWVVIRICCLVSIIINFFNFFFNVRQCLENYLVFLTNFTVFKILNLDQK